MKQSGNSIVLVAVYVDDIVVTGNNSADIQALKAFLHEKFKIKDLEELNYFWGMEITQGSKWTNYDTKEIYYGFAEEISM